ncbi:MAG TPA: hypothetical protein VJK52_03600, partial [Candidatus Nanoarchaeia archaeon]|nr:hypothetical protein [Candidatus Nanoarchaeia archaeon]
MESIYADMEELINEFGQQQGELVLQFEIEEEEYFRTLIVLLWVDPHTKAIISDTVLEAAVERPQD